MPYAQEQLHGADNVATTLALASAAGVSVLVVADGSAFPAVPFTAALGSGTAAYEEVVVTAVTGGTFTLLAATVQPHTAGETVENTIGAEVLDRLADFATAHTHTGGNDGPALAPGGVSDHGDLTGVTANQHHAQAHALDGADHSGTLAHGSLGSVSADQHHAQSHAIGGADHSGQLAHTALTSIGTNTHAQIDTALATAVTNDATAAAHMASAHPALATTGPTTSAEGDAAAVGAGTTAARDNHVHGREAARPVRVASIAAAATLALADGQDIIQVVTGTTTITDITIKPSGSRVTLEFASAGCQVTRGATLLLAGASYVSTARGTLTLECDGSLVWFEVARSPQWAPVASVYHNANQSIGHNAWTILAMNAERSDNDTIHDLVTNNSRLTCKTAGYYLVWASVNFAANVTGGRAAGIQLNSGGAPTGGTFVSYASVPATPGGSSSGLILVRIVPLVVNDYVEVHVFQDSGGALNVVTGTAYSPEFGMRWQGA